MHRTFLTFSICVLVLMGTLGAGCTPQASFEPETIDVDGHALVIKGWTSDGRFCIELKLDASDKDTSLYTAEMVTPDGGRIEPANWSDETPEPPKMSIGFGMGMGGRSSRSSSGGGGGDCEEEGGGRHRSGGRESGSGGGIFSGLGLGVPLGGKADRITAVKACWDLAGVNSPITDCTLEVSLVSYVMKKAEVTTVALAMSHPQQEDDSPKDTDDESAKDLVREIDFTAKAPPERKALAPQTEA